MCVKGPCIHFFAMSKKGICAAACEHPSLHATREALQSSYYSWAASTQIVQVGHWTSTRVPYKDYIVHYGNPTCDDPDLRMPLGTVLVATEMCPGSFALFETAPIVPLKLPMEKRYKSLQNPCYPLLASCAPSAEWTSGPPSSATVVHNVNIPVPGNCRLAFWEAQDFLLRQANSKCDGLKIAWHMIFMGRPFGPSRGDRDPVMAFEERDKYWLRDPDKFTPETDSSEDSKLCDECKRLIRGTDCVAAVAPVAVSADGPLAPVAAGAPVASAPEDPAPEALPVPAVGSCPIGFVLSLDRPFAPHIQEAIAKFGPRAILYVASRGPHDGGPPDFDCPEMTHQPRVTVEALQSVIVEAYKSSAASLTK